MTQLFTCPSGIVTDPAPNGGFYPTCSSWEILSDSVFLTGSINDEDIDPNNFLSYSGDGVITPDGVYITANSWSTYDLYVYMDTTVTLRNVLACPSNTASVAGQKIKNCDDWSLYDYIVTIGTPVGASSADIQASSQAATDTFAIATMLIMFGLGFIASRFTT